jgi:hypothetical protein
MTRVLDPSEAIRKVSTLRTLCLSLPHVPTPAEVSRLRRFDDLVARAESATDADIDALVAGWRRSWRQGDTGRLDEMATRVPTALVESDRRLATYACAAAHLRR